MINHLRTLLLNQSGSLQPGLAYPGEELVAPTYTIKLLPFHLDVVHSLLFGSFHDRAYINWRLREFLPILHDSPMEEAVLDLDPRVTYLPFDNRLYERTGTVITPQPGITDQLYLIQTQSAFAFKSYYNWFIDVVDGSHVSVQDLSDPINLSPPVIFPYGVVDGLSDSIQLPRSPYSFQFQPTSGDAWTVSIVAPPKTSVMDVYKLVKGALTNEILNDIFGSPSVEPYLSFRNVWETSPFPSWQLGALILATGYRINEL